MHEKLNPTVVADARIVGPLLLHQPNLLLRLPPQPAQTLQLDRSPSPRMPRCHLLAYCLGPLRRGASSGSFVSLILQRLQ